MAVTGFNRFIPAYIPLFFGLLRHFRRDVNHNGNIRKVDKTAEKMASMEHMMVRLEKKVQVNRETYEKIAHRILIWSAINSALLIAIAVKIFFF